MAGSYNRIVVVGNVGRDPEMRYTPSGSAVTNFSVATSRRYQKDGEWTEETTWFNVVCWTKLGESANEILRKGRKVLVEGEMRSRKWEDRDGNKRESWEIQAKTFVALDKRPDAAADEGDTDDDDGEVF